MMQRFKVQGSRLKVVPLNLEPPTLNGFTLVELVIAMAILSVGLVGSMRVFPVGLRASAQSEMSSRAAIAAQRTIESLKLQPCDELAEERQTLEDLTVTTRLGQPRSTQLVDPSRLKVVETTVEWTRDGRSRALTFVTYVRCPPA